MVEESSTVSLAAQAGLGGTVVGSAARIKTRDSSSPKSAGAQGPAHRLLPFVFTGSLQARKRSAITVSMYRSELIGSLLSAYRNTV